MRLLLVLVLTAASVLAGTDARPALAVAGDLDPTFGNGGKVTTDFADDVFAGSAERARAMVLQPDGKLVVAGSVERGSSSVPRVTARDIFLARYLPNGALDTTFGSGGLVTTDFGGDEAAFAVVLQPDGRLVAAGTSSGNLLLVRYLPNGELDPSFGSGGAAITESGASVLPGAALTLQPDGKLIAAAATGTSPSQDFMLVRYLPSGSLDPAFGNGGKVSTDFGGNDSARAMVLQPNGKVVVAGRTTPSNGSADFVLARYLPDGALDTTFGSGGRVMTDFGGSDTISGVVLQQDGKLVAVGVGGQGPQAVLLARYLPGGTLDGAFGSGGKVTTQFGLDSAASALALQPDGKLVVAGSVYLEKPVVSPPVPPRIVVVARYLPSGSLDPTFGGGARVITNFGGPFQGASALVVQQDGKLVAVGQGHEGVVLARYATSGEEVRPIGGMGLGITPRRTIDLTWTAGEQQLAYYVARSPTATAMLPDRTTTHFSDTSPAYDGNLNCYTIFPLGQNGPLAQSDVLCAQLGHRSQSWAPLDFTLRLNQSATASLSWTPVGVPTGYVLLAVRVDGSPPRVLELPPTTTQVTDPTGGVFTCYQLYVSYREGPPEAVRSEVACGLPGMSAFPLAAAAPQGTPNQGTPDAPRVRQTAADRGKLDRVLQDGQKKAAEEAGKLRRRSR